MAVFCFETFVMLQVAIGVLYGAISLLFTTYSCSLYL